MSAITSITIGGTAVDLAAVQYSVTVMHGRDSVTEPPTASNAQLVLYIDGELDIPVAISDTVNIQAYGVDRFTGRVVDLALEHGWHATGTPVAALTIQAMGNLSWLGRKTAGDAGYPAENLDTRVAAILTSTGLTYTAETDPYIGLEAYTDGAASVYDLLMQLAEWTGATMYDLPSGGVWFESYTRRGYDYSTATWAEMSTTTWASANGAWSEQVAPGTVAPSPVTLPAAAVVWAPAWQVTGSTIINDVTVAYGTNDPQDTVQQTDAASIAAHGRSAVTIATRLSSASDASRRATNVITAQADERWQLARLEVLIDQLDSTTRAAVLALKSGARVVVPSLPQPAPFDQFLGVVEGWGESYTEDGHRLTLALSDPRYSYATVSWSQAPATATWGGVPATKKWSDIVLPSDLAA